MALLCQPLLLKVVLLSLVIESTPTVYYVRPTSIPSHQQKSVDIDATSCSSVTGDPNSCSTLTEYYTGNYFQSNTVFRLLPGLHLLDNPLIVHNLHNFTLEAASNDSPPPTIVIRGIKCTESDVMHLVTLPRTYAYYDEVFWYMPRCSSIYITDSDNIVLRGIRANSTVEWVPPLSPRLVPSEITFDQLSNVLVERVFAKRGILAKSSNAITVTDSMFGEINSEYQPKCVDDNPSTDARYGVFLLYTSNTILNRVTVANAIYYGFYLIKTTDIQMTNVASHYITYGSLIAVDNAWYTDIEQPFLESCPDTNIFFAIKVDTSLNTTVTGANLTKLMFIAMRDSINVQFSDLTMKNIDTGSSGVFVTTCTNVTFQNCLFANYSRPKRIVTDVISLPSVMNVYFSPGVSIIDCVFTQNQINSINARASDIIFSGEIEFSNNSAPSGAAIIIAKESNVTLEEGSHVTFYGNRAVSSGGAIYISTGEDELSSYLHWCFLHIRGDRSSPRLTFVGNSAGKAGDVLYGGRLAIGYNGIKDNCLQNFLNASNISQISLSTVSSEPSRVCLCNSSGVPDCLVLDWERKAVYPGQTVNISVVVVGQAFGSVTGSVFAQFIRLSSNASVPEVNLSQYTQPVTKEHCNILSYTIYQTPHQPTEAVLALTPQFMEITYYPSKKKVNDTLLRYRLWNEMEEPKAPFPKEVLQYPVYANVTLLPCPLGFELSGSSTAKKCDCNELLQSLPQVECDIIDQTITRSELVWVGVEGESNDAMVASEFCPLNYCRSEAVRIGLGDYDAQCNFGHSGTLCGGCEAGLSLALGTSQCLSCSNWYLALILPFALAGVLLVAFIKLMNLTTSQGTINGLIFYVNVIKVNEFIFLPDQGTDLIRIFISWANLDFGIQTCFVDGLSAYSKTWLQFLFPLYIWAIAGSIVLLSKYSNRVASLMGSNSVSVLATLFFLSYAKLLRIVIVGLSYTVIRSSEGDRVVWSADGSIDYLGTRHAPLFAVCAATLVFVWLPYTLLLFCGQWLYKCKSRAVVRMLGKMTPFLDAHYGPLKGKHRYWFGAQLLLRASILLISSSVPTNRSSAIVLSVSVSAVVLVAVTSIGFYRSSFVSLFEMTFFLNLALVGVSAFFMMSTGRTLAAAPAYFLITAAFAQFVGLVVYQLCSRFKKTRAALAICGWLHGRHRFDMVEEEEELDDWEMYEIAALEREREAREAPKPDVMRVSTDANTADSTPTY